MEENKQIQLWKGIDYKSVEKALEDDYKNYLKTNFDIYKNSSTTIDLDELLNASKLMVGHTHDATIFRQVYDEHNNFFIHTAVNKRDLPIVRYLLTKDAPNQWVYNAQHKSPFDLCIDQLWPQSADYQSDKKFISLLMLDEIFTSMIGHIDNKKLIQKCVTTLINHNLMCRVHPDNTKSIISRKILESLLAKAANPGQTLSLALFYQDAIDAETGNGWAHVIVDQQNADYLYKLIKRNYISPVKNKAGLTALDIALKKFQIFTQEPSLFEMQKEEAARARCCLFMLRKFILLKQNRTDDFNMACNCCDQHIITKQ
jgi:hypothetical protein